MSQVLVMFVVIVVLLVVAAVAGYVAARREDASLRAQARAARVLSDSARRLGNDVTASELTVSAFLLTGNRGLLGAFSQARWDFAGWVSRLPREVPSGLGGLVAAQARAGAAWFGAADQAIRVAPRPGSAEAVRLAARAGVASRDFFAANTAMHARLDADAGRLEVSAQRSLETGLAWSLAAVAVAVALGAAAAVSIIRGVTVPLSSLREAMRRRSRGDVSARADVTGSADLRGLAREFNALAERGDRLGEEEMQRARLREVARDAGARIREHLRPDDVINEARIVIEKDLGADAAYLHVVDEHGKISLPIGHEHDWLLPRDFIKDMPPEMIAWVDELFRTRVSMVFQDLTSPEAEQQLPPSVIGPVRAAGIVSHLLTPFGGDSEMLGFIVAERLRPGHPWTRPEIEAMESIAADIGRGLHHARLYEKEKRLVEELRSVNEMRTEFFTTVAHELRSPLASIEGYVEMLADGEGGPVTGAQRGMLEAVERGAGRLRNLVDNLFTLAKLESGTGHTMMGPVDLAGVVTGAADAVRPSAAAGGLALTSSCPQGLVVDGDAGQLDRALINLLSNAVKFTPGGGQVSVTAMADDDWAVVTVRDSGIGIPEPDRGHLFSRFFRASNAIERRIPGTGLGLAIVRAIVASHGGEVTLQSQEGAGTTVTVRLPLAGSGYRLAEPADRE